MPVRCWLSWWRWAANHDGGCNGSVIALVVAAKKNEAENGREFFSDSEKHKNTEQFCVPDFVFFVFLDCFLNLGKQHNKGGQGTYGLKKSSSPPAAA